MSEQTLTTVLWMDRHSDPSVSVFTDRDDAEQWARKTAREFDRHGAYAEKTYPDGELEIRYSVESDRLSVKDILVDEEVGQ